MGPRRGGRPESRVGRRRFRGVRRAGAVSIPVAVRVVAQIRPSSDDSSLSGGRPQRVEAEGLGVVTLAVPVGTPLPHVAHRLPQTEPVRLVREHRGRGQPPVLARVLEREIALPDVRLPRAVRHLLVTPRKPGTDEATAGCELPLGLGREPPTTPPAVGDGVEPTGVDDRVLSESVDVGSGTVRMTPVRSTNRQPPRRVSGSTQHVDLVGCEREMEHERRPLSLGVRHVSGLAHERRERFVRDSSGIHREGRQPHFVDRRLTVGPIAVAPAVAHQILGVGDDHLLDRMPRARRR